MSTTTQEPETALGIEEEIELFILEMELGEPPKCEYASHHGYAKDECTVEVTHLASDCKVRVLVCSAAARDVELRKIVSLCTRCNRAAYACWHTRVI